MLRPDVRNQVDGFTGRLKEIYGDGLVSVVVYGSAASGEYIDRHSNINLLVVLNDTSLRNLAKASPVVNMGDFRNIASIFMTENYISSSSDVFPIEFLDMKENSLVIYGKDILGQLNIHTDNLRFQCEQELKSKIVNLKRAYLTAIGSRGLEDLLFKSLSSTIHILRNVIRLKGRVPPYPKDQILKVLSEEFGLDTTVPEKILKGKIEKRKFSNKETEELLFDLSAFLDMAAEMVDRL